MSKQKKKQKTVLRNTLLSATDIGTFVFLKNLLPKTRKSKQKAEKKLILFPLRLNNPNRL